MGSHTVIGAVMSPAQAVIGAMITPALFILASASLVASALARQESRGMHLRVDAAEARDDFSQRLLSGGLDDVWTRWEKPATRTQQAAAEVVS